MSAVHTSHFHVASIGFNELCLSCSTIFRSAPCIYSYCADNITGPAECQSLGCSPEMGVSPLAFRKVLYGRHLRGHLGFADLRAARGDVAAAIVLVEAELLQHRQPPRPSAPQLLSRSPPTDGEEQEADEHGEPTNSEGQAQSPSSASAPTTSVLVAPAKNCPQLQRVDDALTLFYASVEKEPPTQQVRTCVRVKGVWKTLRQLSAGHVCFLGSAAACRGYSQGLKICLRVSRLTQIIEKSSATVPRQRSCSLRCKCYLEQPQSMEFQTVHLLLVQLNWLSFSITMKTPEQVR